MPRAFADSTGIATGNTEVVTLDLPEIDGVAHEVDAVEVHRGDGQALTDGDTMMVALTHRTDLVASDFTDDDDDLLSLADPDVWWIRGLSDTDSRFDLMPRGILLAGKQQFIVFNATGGTTSARVTVYYHDVAMRGVDWVLLKRRTSHEGRD